MGELGRNMRDDVGSFKATLQVQTVGDKWICLRTSASVPRFVAVA